MTARMPMAPRAAAARIAAMLADAGYETYFAGGCVRDHLLGLDPVDVDVATAARPEDVAGLFERARGVGAHFGVMLVPSGGRMIEVATFRSDGVYEDGRRPSTVTFGSAEADAARRDFTINGLFEDPASGRIIDFVGGRADLDAGVLRAIGDPNARIEEDRLRMLRAVRFAARFDLSIEPSTFTAIETRAERIEGVSRERIGNELRRMLADPNRAVAARLLESLGLDVAALGAGRKAGEEGLSRLAGLGPDAGWIPSLVAWQLDRAAAGPDDVSTAAVAGRLTEMLVLSNHERNEFVEILDLRSWLKGSWAAAGIAARKRQAVRPGFSAALDLLALESAATATSIRVEVERLALTGLAPAPLIGGDDLVEAGLRPGPSFRGILDEVYDRQLEGALQDRESALALALDLARGTDPTDPRSGLG